jgi:hypothetical protein
MARQGYKFYVYVMPGYIEYFYDKPSAAIFAKEYDCEVKEVA